MVTCGLELEQTHGTSWHGMPPIVRPLIVGRATVRPRPRRETLAGIFDEDTSRPTVR
jgi:hypothetical protein